LNGYYIDYKQELEKQAEREEELKAQEAPTKQKEKKNQKSDVLSSKSKYLDMESNKSGASKR